ncbi:MAG: transposase [Bacteroidetes bacterium]|nr:transposase [Bacteroidota bacterium]
MDKFKNKYRIPSARLQTWDYASDGFYFITICTKNRKHFFGEIVDGPPSSATSVFPVETPNLGVSTASTPASTPSTQIMQLTEIGKLAEKFWMEIPEHFPFIELGNFVVMPNHTHGILIIDKSIFSESTVPTVCPRRDAQFGVSTTIGGKNEKWKPGTIGVIINQYKRICTINARKIDAGFDWQPRFHDHIIRDAKSFERIQNYIATNPQNWKGDKFNL